MRALRGVRKLLAEKDAQFHPEAWDPGHCPQRLGTLGLDEAHRRLLEAENGFYAFDRALHVLGCSERYRFHDLLARNQLMKDWRDAYGDEMLGLKFFAEDLFGNVYGYDSKGVVLLDLESADKTEVAKSFAGWGSFILDDTDFATGRNVAAAWVARHGPIPFDSRLCPKKPFILGGEFTIDNLFVIECFQGLSYRAELARRLKDLPDGTDVVIDFDE